MALAEARRRSGLGIRPYSLRQLVAGDFTLAMWMQSDEVAERLSGDLMSQYDTARHRGFHLTLKSNPGVTSNQANWRHLHDDARHRIRKIDMKAIRCLYFGSLG